jgi:hypothetical protein
MGMVRKRSLEEAALVATQRLQVVVDELGKATFVDQRGNALRAYLEIDPLRTPRGIQALAEHHASSKAERERLGAQHMALRHLLENLTVDEAVAALRAYRDNDTTPL